MHRETLSGKVSVISEGVFFCAVISAAVTELFSLTEGPDVGRDKIVCLISPF